MEIESSGWWIKCRGGRKKILQQTSAAILWGHCRVLKFPRDYSQTGIRDQNICLVQMKRREWEVLQHNLWHCLLMQWWWPVVNVFHPAWHWEWPHPSCPQWRSTVGNNWLYREQNCGTSWISGSLSHYFLRIDTLMEVTNNSFNHPCYRCREIVCFIPVFWQVLNASIFICWERWEKEAISH